MVQCEVCYTFTPDFITDWHGYHRKICAVCSAGSLERNMSVERKMEHSQWTTTESLGRHKRRYEKEYPMVMLVDLWMCTQCRYTEIGDPPEKDGTDHTACTANPLVGTPQCPHCKGAFSCRFGAYAQPMEPCVYVVLFGEQGYLNRCATSRMPVIHEKTGASTTPRQGYIDTE